MTDNFTLNPYITENIRYKTRAKIGGMILDIVKRNPDKKVIGIKNIVAMGKKYNIGNKTIAKYLKGSIFYYGEKKTKIFILREKEIDFCGFINRMEEKFSDASKEEVKIFKILISHLGKRL